MHLPDPLARQHLHQFLALLGLPVVVVDLGVDIARAKRIDVDAEAAPLHSHGTGHVDHRCLAHGIDADLRQHPQASRRRDVDDAPTGVGAGCRTASTGQHALAHLLRHKKGAFDVGVKGKVKILLGHILDALGGAHPRVVDQDVDRADLGLGVGYCRFDRPVIGHVQFHHMGVPAISLDAGAQVFEPLHAPARQHHGSARARQSLGKLGAQTAGGTRHKGHPAG